MKIVPYRVRFEVDVDSDTGKYRFSKPTDDILPVTLSDDGTYYEVSTHDRGDHAKPGPYYQIAFRIEDPSPYQMDELRLSIDNSIYRNSDQPVDNDLYCAQEIKNDPLKNLWYQRSRYEQDNEGKWVIVSENKKSALRVECITTAGVFRVMVYRNGSLLHGNESPWIYVLPSAVSKDDYIAMLNDLVMIHERLVRNDKSSIGIGKMSEIESATERIKRDIDAIKELEEAIVGIMSIPSELQGKIYKKTNINKIKHYDARVVRDYIKNGMSGKILGSEYYEDRDTYENRIIKFILRQIERRHQIKPLLVVDPDIDLRTAVNNEMRIRTAIRPATQAEPVGHIRTFRLRGQPPVSAYHSLRVNVHANNVDITDHAPFFGEDKSWVKFNLIAKSRREIIFYINHLVQCLDHLSRDSEFVIKCAAESPSIVRTGWGNTKHTYVISDLREINGHTFDANLEDITEEEYQRQISELSLNREYLTHQGAFYLQERRRRYKSRIGQDEEEKQKMREDILEDLTRKKDNAQAENELWNVTERLVRLLDYDWFRGVSDIDALSTIQLTPKFQSNRYYSAVYKLLVEMLEDHPLLTSDFNINAFGVGSTQLVYEYWVFCRLLYQFKSLGFVIENKEGLVEHFKNFIQQRQPRQKYSGFVTKATRTISDDEGSQTISVEIGYERIFYTDRMPNGKRFQRTPDYYLCFSNGGSTHWYFMDAKYKCFSAQKGRNKVKYAQEIYDVALSKYIVDIGNIFSFEPETYHSTREDIRGTYIIMANVDDAPSELSSNNRLFGEPVGLLSDSTLDQWNLNSLTSEVIDSGSEGTPAHRYGCIMLTPSYDDELRSLIQLIFEYLEANKKDNHRNLQFCWCCSSDVPVKRIPKYPQKIITDEFGIEMKVDDTERLPKYNVTCPRCKAFRVDNHCINCFEAIIKHTKGNYHRWDDSVENRQWAFLCPDCGSPVNGFEVDLEMNDRLDQRIQEARAFSPATQRTVGNTFTAVETDELPF